MQVSTACTATSECLRSYFIVVVHVRAIQPEVQQISPCSFVTCTYALASTSLHYDLVQKVKRDEENVSSVLSYR